MRKLKIQVQMSLDGYMADKDGGMSFMIWNWDQKLSDYVGALTEPIDTILLGRNLAEGFIDHWKSVAADPSHEEHLAGVKFSQTPKIVFSNSLSENRWENTILVNSDLKTYVLKLKNQPGQDIIAYGGSIFLNNLIDTGLVDEYNLFVSPTAIGEGKRIFTAERKLKISEMTLFDCGIAALKLT